MGQDKDRWRLIISNGADYYKICSFWGWDKDETLFFKLYSNDNGRLYEVENIKTDKKLNSDGSTTFTQCLKYEDIKTTNFYTNKRSFHPSGYTHVNDNIGVRYESGIKTIPFKDIVNFYQLMLIFPQNYENFPRVNIGNLRKNDVIFDSKIFNYSPFQIEVFITKGNKILPSIPKEAIISADIICGENEQYCLFVRCLQTALMQGKKFPPKTFIGTWLLDQNNQTLASTNQKNLK